MHLSKLQLSLFSALPSAKSDIEGTDLAVLSRCCITTEVCFR